MKNYFLHVVIPILTGVGIYIIKYNQKNITQLNDFRLQNFVYYQLPDFLWMYASMNFLWLIWKINSKQLKLYQISMLLLAYTLEIFQKVDFIHGTFDLKDMLAYFLAFISSLLIFKFTFKISKQ